jgi:hypothetical protein
MQTGTTGRVKSEYTNELFNHLFIYGLFNDVNISDNVALTVRMKSGWFGKNVEVVVDYSWYYVHICMEGLRKELKNLRIAGVLNEFRNERLTV